MRIVHTKQMVPYTLIDDRYVPLSRTHFSPYPTSEMNQTQVASQATFHFTCIPRFRMSNLTYKIQRDNLE